MSELKVFVSVGGTATEKQEAFVRAVEDRLRAAKLSPCTVGRNTFSSDSPLKAVAALMNDKITSRPQLSTPAKERATPSRRRRAATIKMKKPRKK